MLATTSGLQLRDYQRECIAAIKEHHAQGKNRVLAVLPTGSGKTIVFASLLAELDRPALILAHTEELVEQARDKLAIIAPHLPVGIVSGASKHPSKITVATIQSAVRQPTLSMLQQQRFEIAVIDEAHHCAAHSYRTVLNELGFGPGTERLLIGVTATPERTDGKGLLETFDAVAYQRNIREMVDGGYLVSPRGIRVALDMDFSNIPRDDSGLDFQPSALSRVLNTAQVSASVVTAWQQHAEGRQTIAFGVTVEHAQRLSSAFEAAGIASGIVHGGLPAEQRKEVLRAYRQGKIQVLCNCMVLTEGFDDPQTSCVLVTRPTMSHALYVQMIGRGLRLWPGKLDCLVLDFGDKRHRLCSVASLLAGYSENVSVQRQEKTSVRDQLPPMLPDKLKMILVEFDLMERGKAFAWKKSGLTYYLQAAESRLIIEPADDSYVVKLLGATGTQVLSSRLDFGYAYGFAEDYARQNRKLFSVSDLEARWRGGPISNKQKAFLQACGHAEGLERLTRGQASTLIGSGKLKTKQPLEGAPRGISHELVT